MSKKHGQAAGFEPVVLTVEETATILNIGLTTVYKLMRTRELTPVKIFGCTRIHMDDINSLIERRKGG